MDWRIEVMREEGVLMPVPVLARGGGVGGVGGSGAAYRWSLYE